MSHEIFAVYNQDDGEEQAFLSAIGLIDCYSQLPPGWYIKHLFDDAVDGARLTLDQVQAISHGLRPKKELIWDVEDVNVFHMTVGTSPCSNKPMELFVWEVPNYCWRYEVTTIGNRLIMDDTTTQNEAKQKAVEFACNFAKQILEALQ